MLKITHSADLQVKDRNIPLFQSTDYTLKYIENYIKNNNIQIHVISGDLFEYCNPNESERKLIYNHLSRLVSIESLKEIVIIAGNHDLVKENKQQLNQKDYNSINIFTDVVNYLGNEKLIYCQKSGLYDSRISNIQYLVYSLEDKDNWNTLKDLVTDNSKFTLCLYHAMIKEYVEYDKLPLSNNVINKLDSLELFPNNSVILAGDIHKNLIFNDNENNKIFVYPGSPMEHTFGEGTYISVGNEIENKQAADKYLMEYVIENDGTFNINKHLISPFIRYITLSLDYKVPYDIIKHIIGEKLVFLKGENQIFIKVKSSNIFVSKERELYDIISKYCKNATINFEYDKFVQKYNDTDNTLIQNIIDEKSSVIKNSITDNENNSDVIISASNIDDLLLSEEQLTKLFDSILISLVKSVADNFDKYITEQDVHEDILNLFRTQLHKTEEVASTRYNIEFESIETNGFMVLGPNKIDLNMPGITRIIGTNGIGKTTLYRMIRWCISGMIFENMSANQVVKNNLLVFNKKLIDVDVVIVSMNLKINGQQIKIERSISRTWKTNTSDAEKFSQNWMDYISSTKRDFRIYIYPLNSNEENVEPKVFVGDQAEKNLLKWFGNTINNILFLNQTKIESILKSNPDKLNEIILNYIGVDYLQKLEENLDVVKSDLLEIQKPKRKKEEIREALIDAKILFDKAENESHNIEISIQKTNEGLKNIEESITEYNDKLIKIGDIEDIITAKNYEKAEHKKILELSIDNKVEKPLFLEQKPIQNVEEIESIESLIVKIENNIKETNLQIAGDKSYIEQVNLELQKEVTKIIEGFYNQLSQKQQEKESVIIERNKWYDTIYNKFTDIVNQLNIKKDEKLEIRSKLINECSNYEQQISDLKKQLQDEICPTCKRPLTDSKEEWDELVKKTKESITDLNQKIEENKKEINSLTDWLSKTKSVIDRYETGKYLASAKDNRLFATQDDGKLLPVDEEAKDNIIKLDLKENDLNYEIKVITEKIEKTKSFEIKSNEIIDYLNKIEQYNQKVNQQENKIQEYNEKKEILRNNIQELKDNYTHKLEEYQIKFDEYNKKCSDIDRINEIIDKQINERNIAYDNYHRLENEIFELKNKLPEYEEFKKKLQSFIDQKNDIQTRLVQLNNDLITVKVKMSSYDHQLTDLNKELDDFIRYTKNNIIWKIYSKLIKTNFKEIVFEYYRTYLNNTLNYLLSDVNFKLLWNKNSELVMISCDNGIVTYQSVQQSSGMEITFLGLALIYTMHVLNVKNTVSNIFIDEVSGTLNKGKELSYSAADYQELFVKILSKFKDKSIFIVDHNIENINESTVYEVIPNEKTSIYIKK